MDSLRFPDGLLRAQQAWNDTYDALAVPNPRHSTVLRQRLLRLSVLLHTHPFWSTAPGGVPGAQMELRRRAQAAVQQRGERSA
ncbi:hypothetical protein SAMN05216483_0043 [Streptomyces sp. 2131.1]|uniref:hypothetical protein n=1 Tax=Streptomyces sp. 2131.1 TaxID=1855346 RepID=UPI00089BC2B8|nr:hypothetical protein [Streptomyces sp. 2131.1]SEB62649.1 hypothetical protein SAMN05216483_0043 [Streptomyces sp. 2131.1]